MENTAQKSRIQAPTAQLFVDPTFRHFLEQEVLPLTTLNAATFWDDLTDLVAEFAPRNQALLQRRTQLQQQIDNWHRAQRTLPAEQRADSDEYVDFLRNIGYLQNEPGSVEIDPEPVDEEIARLSGPQLVVPIKNARFAINAANARWGSLYDALYGSDVIPTQGSLSPGEGYNPVRGAAVIRYAKDFLDATFPLRDGSHHDACRYLVADGELQVKLCERRITTLRNPAQWVGFIGGHDSLRSVFLQNNGLHVEIRIDRSRSPGAEDIAGVQDVIVESALTTIMDGEDSVAAVDTEDKLEVYRNWLGLIHGTLTASFNKNGTRHIRTLNCDRVITGRDGQHRTLRGRSLMMMRNVGLLMDTELLLDARGNRVPEGIVDAVVTALIASLDVRGSHAGRNSQCGNIYVVKPKLHGPDEVAFTDALMERVEDLLRLPRHTIKLGIMDEERRTSVNLKACLAQAAQRVVFINTGFLDRTGDEIHTCMQAGAFLPKAEIKGSDCIRAYENCNVDTGLACGLPGKGQIGKGMWPKPDKMADMMREKLMHPQAGANTAWVPSPTAATLHALHYHQVNVRERQKSLYKSQVSCLENMLTPPLLPAGRRLSEAEIVAELQNNVQGILGYVVRWINQGIGCSKVPDFNQVGLMEDRATLRISSQHIANWLLHGLCNKEQVLSIMTRMAALVDKQNQHDPDYRPMTPQPENSLPFQAACALIFDGNQQPNGYTEPVLHHYRKLAKNQQTDIK
ncbi:malate synthase G [Pseudohongiella spirulinae]|uniref:Malate synthase G n=1 Tax=Pseudohongiella spirulinae TaxID=1249552 RepID=A0A0S2KGS6_9GAMM|nr:malate synthase G [Pseudohongiella spirulinae]ALO47381.1 Malate synthase G [Pseudohongiella spirulinae]